MIEPLRLIGFALFVLSVPTIKTAYDRVVEQEENETPDLGKIFKSQLVGRVGIFCFLSGLVFIVNGGEL